MLSEHERNWLLQLELDTLRSGKKPDIEMTPEQKESFEMGLDYLRQVRDKMGPEAFSKVTIDVGYDY